MLDADVCKGKSRPHAYKSGQRVGNRYFLRMSFMNDPFTLNSATARTLVASVPGMATGGKGDPNHLCSNTLSLSSNKSL